HSARRVVWEPRGAVARRGGPPCGAGPVRRVGATLRELAGGRAGTPRLGEAVHGVVRRVRAPGRAEGIAAAEPRRGEATAGKDPKSSEGARRVCGGCAVQGQWLR